MVQLKTSQYLTTLVKTEVMTLADIDHQILDFFWRVACLTIEASVLHAQYLLRLG